MVELRFPDVNLEGISGVLLDIDNTLYCYDNAHEKAMLDLASSLNKIYDLNWTQASFISNYKKARKRVNIDLDGTGASHSRFFYIQKLIEQAIGHTDLKNTLLLEDTYWNTFLRNMTLDEKAKEFVIKCKDKGIEICCITDLTAEIQFRKLINLNLQNHVKYVVTSEEAGVEKPHPYIFKLALEKLNLPTEKVVMIGDNEKKDIIGAQLLNIESYLVEIIKK